jgi:hypothetical protein
MATYGSRDKNPFKVPTTYKINGVDTPSNNGNTKYYILVDSTTGEITIKSPTVTGAISGAGADRTIGVIPKDNTFKPTPGSATVNEIKYFESAVGQKAVKNHGVITAQKAGAKNAQQLIFPNSAAPNPTPTPTTPTTPTTPGPDQKETLTEEDLNFKEQIQGDGRKSYDNLIYPTSLKTNKQDYIKFTIFNYKASKLDKKSATSLVQNPYIETESIGSIILPIQPSISDSNVVDWGGKELSPVDIGLLSLSDAGMKGSVEQATDIFRQLGNTVFTNENVKKAIILKLKERALNVEGLLSRFGGAIVNPNLELLFQGPTLRPFNFTFRLSPRSEGEATQVRSIIRAFKEAMAPQVSKGGLFLATPRVFNISYHTPGKEMHPSINRIKTCALQSCNVDYTPDGSYMTFNDDNRTMTSYNLTLQFSELEPVTSKDYFDNNKPIPVDHIGY